MSLKPEFANVSFLFSGAANKNRNAIGFCFIPDLGFLPAMKFFAAIFCVSLAFILQSCRESNTSKLSLVVYNTGVDNIDRVDFSSDLTKEGVQLLNIFPAVSKSWYPLDINLGGSMKVRTWREGNGEVRELMRLNQEMVDVIVKRNYLVINIGGRGSSVYVSDDNIKLIHIGDMVIDK